MKIVFTICVVLGLFFACPFALGAPSTLTLVCCDNLPESSGRTLHIDFAASTVNGHPGQSVAVLDLCEEQSVLDSGLLAFAFGEGVVPVRLRLRAPG